MDIQTHQKLSGALVFLENHCPGDYCISRNRIVYNDNLHIPAINGIAGINLSVIDVKGVVKVSSRDKLRFDYLPYAKGFSGLRPENLSFANGTKISRKKLEERGFSQDFCREISRRQILDFLKRLSKSVRGLSRRSASMVGALLSRENEHRG